MNNPYIETAETELGSLGTVSLRNSNTRTITETAKAQALLAIAFEMNRFNNLLEDENKKGGTLWYIRDYLNDSRRYNA